MIYLLLEDQVMIHARNLMLVVLMPYVLQGVKTLCALVHLDLVEYLEMVFLIHLMDV